MLSQIASRGEICPIQELNESLRVNLFFSLAAGISLGPGLSLLQSHTQSSRRGSSLASAASCLPVSALLITAVDGFSPAGHRRPILPSHCSYSSCSEGKWRHLGLVEFAAEVIHQVSGWRQIFAGLGWFPAGSVAVSVSAVQPHELQHPCRGGGRRAHLWVGGNTLLHVGYTTASWEHCALMKGAGCLTGCCFGLLSALLYNCI